MTAAGSRRMTDTLPLNGSHGPVAEPNSLHK